MEKRLDDYLERIEKYLKPLPLSERMDIVKEIKSDMLDLQRDGKTVDEIIERLGSPKELAKAYLGNLIARSPSSRWNRVLAICAFYSLVGFSGMFLVPCLTILAPALLLCGVASPLFVAIKWVDAIFHFGWPYMDHIGIFIGTVELPLAAEFAVALLIGLLLFFAGRGCWKLLLLYCQKVSKGKMALSVK